MKKLLVGLLALGSISSYAKDCNINISDSSLINLDQIELEAVLSQKGYTIDNTDSSKKLKVVTNSYLKAPFLAEALDFSMNPKNTNLYVESKIYLNSKLLKERKNKFYPYCGYQKCDAADMTKEDLTKKVYEITVKQIKRSLSRCK